MLNLIFFTTNKVKLAHARYMAENYPIKIKGFKEKTYHASYDEPRINIREELLQSSYKSALAQATKGSIDTTRRFFFLEDTSLIIEALSTPEEEIPGVNVKDWMKTQTFDSINTLLMEHGNNRKVTVRSDILLHVPEPYKTKWGLEKSYVVFTGYQEGKVGDQEYNITTNCVYPWLDNKTFNKWFVPPNTSVPISLLPISEANKYDFRRHAFSQMVKFLKEKGGLSEEYKQTSLGLEPFSTWIVCGFTCAGKTTISQHLIRKYGYMHIEASDFMYLNYYLRHDVSSEIKIGDFAEIALIEKPQIAAEKIAEYMEENSNLPTIISGFRSKKEIEWLRSYFGNGKKFGVVFIEASETIRFERQKRRNRYGKGLTLEDFRALDKQQVRMGLSEIAAGSDVTPVENEGSFNEFFEQFEGSGFQNPIPLEDREIDLSRFKEISDNVKLEDSIFIALLSKWKYNEDREFFTTTAISKLIRDIFPFLLKPKHKDNVSRYFNQDFYPFYDIEPNGDENKKKYRLSNTGYGEAMQVFHKLIRESKGEIA
ncbi:MAG: AAA family ATPase [Nitrospinae bacterium]|nr:AAA family ATPase [Nitrospinota bacterium]